ncbi:MAG: SpaA isopeptide-forming pilin-related protein [bacterium]|nr:SpaA isopeptide-forming pilin-related protein [bacterium]
MKIKQISKKKIFRIFSAIAIFLVAGSFLLNAAVTKLKSSAASTTFSSGIGHYFGGYTIPYITGADGSVAYCLNHALLFPTGQNFNGVDGSDVYNSPEVKGILYYGYAGAGHNELMQKHGLGAHDARLATQLAIWKYGRRTGSIPGNQGISPDINTGNVQIDNYINELIGKTYNGNTATPVSVTQNVSTRVDGDRQVSDIISLGDGLNHGNVQITYSGDNGQARQDNISPTSFTVSLPKDFSGNVVATITGPAGKNFTPVVWTSGNGAVQNLISSGGMVNSSANTASTNINFDGVAYASEVSYRIKKTDVNGVAKQGAIFEVATDENFTQIIKTLTSRDDGYTPVQEYTFPESPRSAALRSITLYVREKAAPTGMTKSDEVKRIVLNRNQESVSEISYENQYKPITLKIVKKDESGQVVPNVRFIVSEFSDFSKGTISIITRGNGEASVDLPYNTDRKTLYVREESVPDHLVLSTEVKSVRIEAGQTGVVEFVNQFKTSNSIAKIIKKDASGSLIQGVVFEIATNQQFTDAEEFTTNAQGEISKTFTVAGLQQFPTVYVREKSTLAHLIKSNEVKTVTLRAGETSSVEFVNQFKGALAKIVKKDASNRAIQGVRFEIATNPQFTNSETLTTGVNGEISKSFQITTVTPPTIYVREVSAPSYLVVDNRVQSKPLVIDGAVDFEFVNQFNQAPITIRKTDEKGKNIAGVVFELSETRDFARIFDTVTTNAQGLVNKTYPTTQLTKVLYIREKSVPSHLVLSKEIKEITLAPNTTPTVTFVNDFVERDVELSKSDLSSADPIEGVTLTIYDASDENNRTKIYENITNKDGKLPGLKLKPGKYKFIETHATIGYKINPNPHFFEVLEDGTILGSTVMTDEREEYEFEIDKVDNKGNKVRGVVFEAKNKLTGEILTATTDENGVAKFKGIWADYEIKEKSAPEGYIKDENTYVLQLKKDGTYERMKVVNNKVEAPNTGAENGGILPILVSVGSILFAGTAFLIKRRA